MQYSGKAMSQDFMKSARFHEICQISCEIRQILKDQQLPGMVRPMFFWLNKLCWLEPKNDEASVAWYLVSLGVFPTELQQFLF